MKSLSTTKILLLKFFGLLIIFQTALFSANIYHVSNSDTISVNSQVLNNDFNRKKKEVEIVALDSFGEGGVVLMIIFTSLLGVFFVRDEFKDLV